MRKTITTNLGNIGNVPGWKPFTFVLEQVVGYKPISDYGRPPFNLEIHLMGSEIINVVFTQQNAQEFYSFFEDEENLRKIVSKEEQEYGEAENVKQQFWKHLDEEWERKKKKKEESMAWYWKLIIGISVVLFFSTVALV